MSTSPQGWQDPKTDWKAADVMTPTAFNRVEGNTQAIELGERTINPAQAPSGLVGTLRQWLDWFANRIKAITGEANWHDAPATTLKAAKSHIDAAAPHSGHFGPAELSDLVLHQTRFGRAATTTIVDIEGAGWIVGGTIIAGSGLDPNTLRADITIDGGEAQTITATGKFNLVNSGSNVGALIDIPPFRYSTSVKIEGYFNAGNDYAQANAQIWSKSD